MNDLRKIGAKHKTDKVAHGYMEVYHEYFSEFRDKEINILEIGVYNGASVRTWREYFPKANIIGVDVVDKSSIFNSLSGNKKFFLADQGNPEDLKMIVEEIRSETSSGFDIVIDDGSHFQHDIMVSFGNLFPHMNSNGVYVIEDMCTANGIPGVPGAVGLVGGGPWWGSKDEIHRTRHLPGLALSANMNKEWLPGGKKDLFHCAETTMERFEKTGILTNAFLSEEQCRYITENFHSVKFYKAKVPPITGTSSIAVVVKKGQESD